ncbi:site-2 protease family protein [Anaerobacillus sp. MEB173]|uniref:site-2 protease family protein n=1 Tax=Anaerobacillus sp. MEB173 TaxID=3383345 RepID=UPI003F9190E6
MFILSLILYFITIVPLTTFIHELGHLFTAQMMAVKKLRLTIGTGPVLKRWQIYDFHFTLRLFFFIGGYATTDSDKEIGRKRRAFIALGGPLLNGLVVFGLLLPGFGTGTASITYWFQWFALYNLWVCVVNLIPFQRGHRQSDGYIVYQSIWSRGD